MPEILLVNPRRRKSRKTRSAAQRAATARMLAANRRRNPKARKASKRRRNPVPALSVMHNPRRRATGRRRRNPISLRGFSVGSHAPVQMVKSALVGAVGATAVNSVLARLPVPASLMVGRMRYLTQAAAAIGLGMIASKLKVVGAGTAAKMAEGSLVVTLHDAIKDVAAGAGLNLGGMGYYLPGRGVQAVPSASGSPAQRLSEYVTGPGSPQAQVLQMPRKKAGMAGFNF